MFSSIGWGEIAVLLVAGLVILGPERLPGAVTWTMQSIRKARDYATGATSQLKDELGTDFEDLRKPLADLNELRGMTPRALVTKHLLEGDDSIFTSLSDATTIDRSSTPTPPIKPVSKPLPIPENPPQNVAGESVDPGSSGSSGTGSSTTRHDIADWDAT